MVVGNTLNIRPAVPVEAPSEVALEYLSRLQSETDTSTRISSLGAPFPHHRPVRVDGDPG